MNRGGKLVTPMREAMSSAEFDGVVFRCSSKDEAEKVRISTIIVKKRNNMDIRTHRQGNDLIAYKADTDLFEDTNYICVDLAD